MNIIACNSNSIKKKLYAKVWKFNFKNIYPTLYDIDPTVDFVFPVNKIDRENSGKK
jgi:hypothetical protein